MIRLFVALRPPPAIRDLLAEAMAGVPAARWQDDDQLHLTLRFIGPVERPVAEDVAAALSRVHAQVPSMATAGVGRFAHRGRTDTLWAGVSPPEPLTALHRKIDHACVSAGLPPSTRTYLPHITLARLPRAAGIEPAIDRWIADHAGLASAPFAPAHLVLYQSHLDRGGARYEPVARRPLG